jgi:hypothetical protein
MEYGMKEETYGLIARRDHREIEGFSGGSLAVEVGPNPISIG